MRYLLLIEKKDGTFRFLEGTRAELVVYPPGPDEGTTLLRDRRDGR